MNGFVHFAMLRIASVEVRKGEVAGGELAVEAAGFFVIRAGGVDFIGEVAEVVAFVVAGYLGGPFFASFVPVDAFVF